MKKSIRVTILVMLIMVAVAGGYFWSRVTQTPASIPTLNTRGLNISYKNDRTVVRFTTKKPGFCQVLIGTKSGLYNQVGVESMPDGPHTKHYNVIKGLKPDTQYVYRINFTTTNGDISQSQVGHFKTTSALSKSKTTLKSNKPAGVNIASAKNGAKILGVSSNYGNVANHAQWGADMAIDGNPSTEWSSNGDGNKAWIKIGFAKTYQVTTIGFWTRTMGTSAQIKKFKVLSANGQEIGVFSLKGSKKMEYFTLKQTVKTNALRFDVVNSTGGNTGAVEIAVYGK